MSERAARAEGDDAEEAPRTERPLTSEEAADAVQVAVSSANEAALEALAENDEPDPWLVADALCFRGEHDAADAFAKAAPRKAVEKLAGYVASRLESGSDEDLRSLHARVEPALRARDWGAVRDLTEECTSTPDTVVGILLLHGRGVALANLRRYRESADVLRAAAASAQDLGWRGRGARSLFLAGNVAFHGSDWENARSGFQDALEAYETLGDLHWMARARNHLGLAHQYLGNSQNARGHYERALAEFQALDDRPGIARCLGNLGVVHRILGDYPKTLELYALSMALYEADGDRMGVARSLGNRGVVHQRLGDFPAALRDYERSIVEFKGVGDRLGVARNLLNIGGTHTQLGDDAQALETCEKALALFRELGNPEGILRSLLHCAIAQAKLRDRKQAMKAASEALEMAEAAGDRIAIAVCRGNLGFIYLEFGEMGAALHDLERALESLEGEADSALHVLCLKGLAKVYLSRGELDDAIRCARDAVAALSGIVGGLGEQQGAGAREVWIEPFEIGASAALRAGSKEALVYFLESGRAGGLREALGARRALGEALIPAEMRAAEAEARAREVQAVATLRLARLEGRLDAIRDAKVALGKARDALQASVERMQRKAKAGADVAYPKAAPLAALQASLGEAETLLLFGAASDESVAVAVTHDQIVVRSLGTLAEIEALVEALDLANPEEDSSEALAELRARVARPLGLGDQTTSCLISPHGALSYVPFALLLPEREVAYVPSGTTFGLLRDAEAMCGELVLALGDPDYGVPFDPGAVATLRGGRALMPLPGTREEARTVGDRILLDRDATEAGLARAAQDRKRWRAIHLACHGLIDTERPMFSSLALTPGEGNDGLLTCLEIFRMKFPADLVVLSACETATGTVYRAEGIVGLTRAFMFAGAPRIICSLWKVDDEATCALMVKFYELWNPGDGKGLGTAAALKKAQEYVRDHRDHPEWKHPHYWAAWVLWGLPD